MVGHDSHRPEFGASLNTRTSLIEHSSLEASLTVMISIVAPDSSENEM
jgi:hypothetical protein